jgi:hypothetical protein
MFKTEISRWLLVFLIGILTGATAFLVNYTIRTISFYKFSLVSFGIVTKEIQNQKRL